MQLVQCSKGHFYDSSLGSCPRCAEEAQNGSSGLTGFELGSDAPTYAPAPGGAGSIGATAPVQGFGGDDIGRTMPIGQNPMSAAQKGFNGSNPGPTVGVTNPGFSGTEFVDGAQSSGGQPGGWVIDDYAPTMPTFSNGQTGFDPVVGWLVCVKGPNRGKDYRLHSGTNFIGSDKKMDVCLENDRTISHKNAASISYDAEGKTFFVQKGDGRNLIYLNGKAVRNDADLAIYDRLRIGETELVFVPLCCEQFTWQDM